MSMCNCNQGRLPCTCKPAGGDVKVLGYSVKGNRYAIRLTKGELLELSENYTGTVLIELVDRAHVTRLQAEVERLGSIGRGQRKTIDNVQLQVERLQSELTKARELLAPAKTCCGSCPAGCVVQAADKG